MVFGYLAEAQTQQNFQPLVKNCFKRIKPSVIPLNYPPQTGAVEVWDWGTLNSGTYITPITGDAYIEGSGGATGHQYLQPGPTGTNMGSIYWRNDGSFNSHHTAPGTTAGQSNAAVDSSLQPGTSNFKFYFVFKKPLTGLETFYYFFDYDQQADASTFNQGLQFFVSASGLFFPCSIVALVKDSVGNLGEYHAKTGGTRLCGDNQWHIIEMIFNKAEALPTYKIDGEPLLVINTFSGPALNSIGTISPTNGVRFGMREFSETTSGRADLYMAAAAYSKSLTYEWR